MVAEEVSLPDRLYVSCACTVLLLHAATVLRRTTLSSALRGVRLRLRALAAAAEVQLRAQPFRDSKAPLENYVQLHLQTWRVEQARHSVALLARVMCITVIPIVIDISVQRQRWVSKPQAGAVLCIYALSVVMDASSQAAGPWTLALWSSVTMCLVCSSVMPFAVSPALLPVTMMALAMPRLLMASLASNVLLSSFWNIVLSSVACYSYVQGSQNGEQGPLSPRNYVSVELFTCFLTILGLSVSASSKIADKRREIENRAQSREQSAMGTLLDAFCDVVVELDEDFHIVDDAPKFGSMLLRGADRSLRGTPFYQFVPSEQEQRHFVSRMTSPEAVGSMAQAFHIRLRDSLSNELDMELFHVQFDGLDGRSRHLLGMREFTDAPGMPSSQNAQNVITPELHSSPASPSPNASHSGTPSVAASFERGLQLSPRSQTESLADTALAPPQIRPVLDEAQTALVFEMLARWNVNALGSNCCTFHTALSDLTRIVAQMECWQCTEDLASLSGWQCSNYVSNNRVEEDRLCHL